MHFIFNHFFCTSLYASSPSFYFLDYIYVTPIGGKVLFKKLIFGNNDYCIRAAGGSFTIRWWPGKVRGFGEEDDRHPCRLELRVSGLEVVWYNNCGSFDRFDPSKKNQTIHTESMVLPSDFKLPLFYRLSPAIKLSITVGSITLGQPDTPALTHITFKRGTGVHLVGPASCKDDYYRHSTTVDFINAKCRVHSISSNIIYKY